jgi:hypothetical protein
MKYRFGAIVLLLIMGWLELSTLAVTAATSDEPMHILRGYALVSRGKYHIPSCVPCSPALSGTLIGSGLLLEPNLNLPPDSDPGWQENSGFGLQEAFLWSNTVDPLQMIYLARLPIVFVSILLGAFIYLWASRRSGAVAGLGALTLYVFSPNMLANARLATTDVVAAATFAAGAFAFSRALDVPRRMSRLKSGVALGLALAAKVSAVWLPVAFVIQMLARFWKDRRNRRAWIVSITTVLISFVVGGLTLWAVYRFSIGPIDPGGPSVPAPAYWGDWQDFANYLRDPLPSYLFGQISNQGWWYFFPITFLVKTPLPVLLLLLIALARTVRARSWSKDAPLLLAPGLLFASLLFSPHDLGYRYLLPLLPFIFVYAGDVIAAAARARWTQIVIGLLIVWQVVGTLRYYPYYLTFFNEIAGGPDRGRYILIDSNLDWGQDLPALKQYVDEHHLEQVRFSYSGATPPGVYGLKTQALPPFFPPMRDQGAWWLHTLYPPDPPPGHYALSVTGMMGDPNDYAFFRDRMPDAIVGNSIYIYTVPAHGVPADLSLAGLQVDQIDPDTFGQFGTNDLRLRWFDATTSLIASPDPTWVAVTDNQPIAKEFQTLFDGVAPTAQARTTYEDRSYKLYHFDLGTRLLVAAQQAEQSAAWSEGVYPDPASMTFTKLPASFDRTAELIGYHVVTASQSSNLTVVTYWRAGDQAVAPLQLFVHALGPDGQVAAQEDRLDAQVYGWRVGDVIAQISHLKFAQPPQPGQAYWLEVGLYHSDTGERVPVVINDHAVGQRLLLKPIQFR